MTEGVRDGNHLWSIILAGGDGSRMEAFVMERFGRMRPKQYCAFIGTRSMFQHTVDRAAHLTPPDRMVTVVARHHRQEVLAQLAGRDVGTVIFQPANRDTAAGVFLPLTYVRRRDPDATVVLFPSDHFVYPESQLLAAVRRATVTLADCPERLLLLGVSPDRPAHEYGWIAPGPWVADGNGLHAVRSVQAFVEKPDLADAQRLYLARALWNTFIVVARVRTLWAIGRRHVPAIMRRFETLSRVIGGLREDAILERIYPDMPAKNFSSDVLQRAAGRLGVVELRDVWWSDWGKPERVVESLAQMQGDLVMAGEPSDPSDPQSVDAHTARARRPTPLPVEPRVLSGAEWPG